MTISLSSTIHLKDRISGNKYDVGIKLANVLVDLERDGLDIVGPF